MASFNAMAVDVAGARERLVKQERQAAWAQVARRLAHDIKNPLTPIQLAIEEVETARLAHDPGLEDAIARAAKTIKAEVRVLRELVQGVRRLRAQPRAAPRARRRAGVARSRHRPLRAELRRGGARLRTRRQQDHRRPRPARARVRQPGQERVRGDGGPRHALGVGAARRERGRDRHRRQRPRRGAGRPRAHLHALLHDQARGHGAWPGHRAARGRGPRRHARARAAWPTGARFVLRLPEAPRG